MCPLNRLLLRFEPRRHERQQDDPPEQDQHTRQDPVPERFPLPA